MWFDFFCLANEKHRQVWRGYIPMLKLWDKILRLMREFFFFSYMFVEILK